MISTGIEPIYKALDHSSKLNSIDIQTLKSFCLPIGQPIISVFPECQSCAPVLDFGRPTYRVILIIRTRSIAAVTTLYRLWGSLEVDLVALPFVVRTGIEPVLLAERWAVTSQFDPAFAFNLGHSLSVYQFRHLTVFPHPEITDG